MSDVLCEMWGRSMGGQQKVRQDCKLVSTKMLQIVRGSAGSGAKM